MTDSQSTVIPASVKDLSGKVFHKWTVLHFIGMSGGPQKRRTLWMCRCKCGQQVARRGCDLASRDLKCHACDGSMTTSMANAKEKLAANIRITANGCWEWIRARDGSGYGYISIDAKLHRTHVLSHKLYKGSVEDGLFVCHHCDNPPCCNPDHLFLGTAKDNCDDMFAKGRRKRRITEHKSGRIKLTEQQRAEIRHAYSVNGNETTRSLCNRYGVGKTTIWRIVRGLNPPRS